MPTISVRTPRIVYILQREFEGKVQWLSSYDASTGEPFWRFVEVKSLPTKIDFWPMPFRSEEFARLIGSYVASGAYAILEAEIDPNNNEINVIKVWDYR